MSKNNLSELQQHILVILSTIDPRWTLVGGGALVGFHLGHRKTRDLDLFWRQRQEIGDLEREVAERCRSHGLEVRVIQHAPAFVRLQVADQTEQVLVDLVADALSASEPPMQATLEGVRIQVASTREILAAKFCALLSRTEIRDLHDIMALVANGEAIEPALKSAGEQDGGFSILTLAWVLNDFAIRRIATVEKLDDVLISNIEQFQQNLIERLLALAKEEVTHRQ